MSINEEIIVSVFCTCYNHENYIRDCLDGFIMQETNFKFEVLVHDDASTDNSAEIIREYEKKYPDIIKPIYQTKNQYSQGVQISTEILLPKANGKYIAFCEGDDYWTDKQKLKQQYDILEKHDDCVICVHKVDCFDVICSTVNRTIPNKDAIHKYSLNSSRIIMMDELVDIFWKPGIYPFQTSSYFIKKEVLNLKLNYPRDEGILKKAMSLGQFYYICESLSIYRTNVKGSWNDRQKEKKNKDYNKIFLINNDIKFDKFTKQKFHEHILFANYVRAKLIEDKKLKNKCISKYNLKLRNVLFVSSKTLFSKLMLLRRIILYSKIKNYAIKLHDLINK